MIHPLHLTPLVVEKSYDRKYLVGLSVSLLSLDATWSDMLAVFSVINPKYAKAGMKPDFQLTSIDLCDTTCHERLSKPNNKS